MDGDVLCSLCRRQTTREELFKKPYETESGEIINVPVRIMVCYNPKCKQEYLTMEQDRDYNKAIREIVKGEQ